MMRLAPSALIAPQRYAVIIDRGILEVQLAPGQTSATLPLDVSIARGEVRYIEAA